MIFFKAFLNIHQTFICINFLVSRTKQESLLFNRQKKNVIYKEINYAKLSGKSMHKKKEIYLFNNHKANQETKNKHLLSTLVFFMFTTICIHNSTREKRVNGLCLNKIQLVLG